MRQNALTKSAKFKLQPDIAIEEYRLPLGCDYARIVLKDKLLLQIRKIVKSGRVARYDKDFYLKTGATSRIKLGRFPEMSYAAALAASEKIQKEGGELKIAPKNALSTIFDDFLKFKGAGLKETTIIKKRKIFNSKLGALKDTPITEISLQNLQDIGCEILQKATYSALEDYCFFINQLFGFAYARGHIPNDILRGGKLVEIFTLPKRISEYPHIKNEPDLKSLCRYIGEYPHTGSVRNALKFAFATALRSGNVRNLRAKHLKVDANGEYFLKIPAHEMKVAANGDMYLGLPRKLGEWLKEKQKFATSDGLIFSNMNGNVLSDATLSKALKSCVLEEVEPLKSDGEMPSLVCHSLRKIFSTFANYERKKGRNGLSWESIECVLGHAIGAKIIRDYDKSGRIEDLQIELTRNAITWWLEYIEEKGFRL